MALRFGRWAAPGGEGGDAEDADRAAQGEGNDLPGTHFLGAFEDALAVDADVPGMDQSLRKRAALRQPDAVQITIDPH